MSSLRLSSSINSTNIISLITTSALSFYAGYRCYHILIKKNNNNEKNENISNYSTSSSSSTTVELNYTTTETIPLMNSVGKIKSPNPNWKIGEIQNMEEKVYESILADDLLKTQGALYNLMISTIIPRPIALVTSKNLKGEINCAPFSFFNMVSYDPPLIVLGMCLSAKNTERIKKDSLVNVEEMKEFVVNIMSSKYIESGNHTCGNFPSDVNEMERSGLTSLDSHLISSPRVAQADIQFECEVSYYYLLLYIIIISFHILIYF